MDDSLTALIFSAAKVLVGFVICLGISFFALKVFFVGLLISYGIPFLGGEDKKKGFPVLILGAFFCLLTFPLGAWVLQNDLKILELDRIPQYTFTVIFGCLHLIIYSLFKIWGKKILHRNKSRNVDVKYFY